jgi:formate dehydrogenase iron-sulfur subunit
VEPLPSLQREEQPAATTDNYLTDKLSANTYTVVSTRNNRFVRQMMHCESPTCASVCPVGALVKTAGGPVVYDGDKCMGCRYCMQACPFSIPTYEWDSALPRVRKCTLCNDRVAAGLPTACAAVCPTGATKFGDRDALIEEAEARIRANPDKYVNHIYGVEEVGGTSVLLLSDVPFETLGYRTSLSKEPLPLLTWNVLQKIPNLVTVGSVVMAEFGGSQIDAPKFNAPQVTRSCAMSARRMHRLRPCGRNYDKDQFAKADILARDPADNSRGRCLHDADPIHARSRREHRIERSISLGTVDRV